MKTKFFGAFKKNMANDATFDKIRNTRSPFLIRSEEEFRYEEDGMICMTWGNFYDLEKTCTDLGLKPSGNPACVLAMAMKNDNYRNSLAFYGEFTFLFIENEKVVLGRDLVGAGLPVFYSDKFFGNSIDDFKSIKEFDFTLDQKELAYFLHLGTPLPPGTMIKNLNQLGPGQYLIYSNGETQTHSILSYQDYDRMFGTLDITGQEAVNELERLHKQAIKRRIAGKEHVALLMSGGYDSGGNVAALRDIFDGKVTGYSIGFKNDKWSELPLAKLLADHFQVDFHDYQINGSEIDELPVILKSLGFPFQENGLMVNYTVMKRVSHDSNDIILGGDGNDQVYGTGMQQVALHFLAARYGLKPLQKILSGVLSGTNQKLLSKVNFHNNRILHAADFTTFGFSKSELNHLLQQRTEDLITDVLKRNQLNPASFDELFKAHSYFKDFMHDGNNLIIFKASNMARLFGQQLSFPYMDKDCIEFVMKLPRTMRFSGSVKEIAKGQGIGKYLHKKYLKPKLPEEITNRKKQGGFAPLPIFFKDKKQRKIIYEIIKKSSLTGEIFNLKSLDGFLDQFEKSSQNPDAWFWYRQSMAFRIFNLLVLVLWWEIHFNNKNGNSLNNFT
jgi:asparagine synthase (glutamine-hydrolysing)